MNRLPGQAMYRCTSRVTPGRFAALVFGRLINRHRVVVRLVPIGPAGRAAVRVSSESAGAIASFSSKDSQRTEPLTESLVSDADPSNRRRSERVMLQIRITVIAETRDRVQVQENTHTLVVNAHGGLIKLKMDLLAGQPIILVNPQTGVEESGHVVRIDQPSPDYFAVAFEFELPSPKFWPVVFPPKDWENPET
jgi:hypothetical protein